MNADQTDAARAFQRQRDAMAVTDTTGPEKAVLLVLAIMANTEGQAWPPVSGPTGIAARSSLGRRTVQEALRGLEVKGWIETDERPGKGSVYTLHLEVRASRTGAPAAHVQEPRTRCAPAAPKQPRTTIPQKASPSSVAKPPKNAVETLPDLPAGVTPDQWADFVEMRRKMDRGAKGRPWTAGAAKRIIADLHKLASEGLDPGEAINASIANGWAGVRFAKSGDRHGKQHGAPDRRGPRPDPAYDLWQRARREIEAEEATAGGGEADRGTGPALPSYLTD